MLQSFSVLVPTLTSASISYFIPFSQFPRLSRVSICSQALFPLNLVTIAVGFSPGYHVASSIACCAFAALISLRGADKSRVSVHNLCGFSVANLQNALAGFLGN
jgi:hypothetical protein